VVSSSLSCSILISLVLTLRPSPGDRQLSRRRVVVDQPIVTRTDAAPRRRPPPHRPSAAAAATAAVTVERRKPAPRPRPVQTTARGRLSVPLEAVITARRQACQDAPPPSSSSPSSAAESRQEAAERVHVVHERDAFEGDRRVYVEGIGGHQPDTRQKGSYLQCSRYR